MVVSRSKLNTQFSFSPYLRPHSFKIYISKLNLINFICFCNILYSIFLISENFVNCLQILSRRGGGGGNQYLTPAQGMSEPPQEKTLGQVT